MPVSCRPVLSLRRLLLLAALMLACGAGMVMQARALGDDLPAYEPEQQEEAKGSPEQMPLPDPAATEAPANTEPGGDAMRYDPDQAAAEVLYDLDLLPEPVRRMRRLIIEASRSGEVERLRPLIGTGSTATQLSLGPLPGDPIDFLREISGDEEGQEILAILLEVMESGFVRLDAGTEQELYAWPYFFAIPLEDLTAEQRVELFTLVTAGDYEQMKSFGAYIFYRVAITPDGHWVYFVAGD